MPPSHAEIHHRVTSALCVLLVQWGGTSLRLGWGPPQDPRKCVCLCLLVYSADKQIKIQKNMVHLVPFPFLVLHCAVLGWAAEEEYAPHDCEAPSDDAVYATDPRGYFPDTPSEITLLDPPARADPRSPACHASLPHVPHSLWCPISPCLWTGGHEAVPCDANWML